MNARKLGGAGGSVLKYVTDGNDEADAAVAASTKKARKQGGAGECVLKYVTDGNDAADAAVAASTKKEL